MATTDILNGQRWRVDCGDCIEWLNSLPEDSVDLVCGSPPYEDCRTYGIDFSLEGQAWVDWMVRVCVAARRVCKGLCAFVLQGKTRDYRWSATPALLAADLHRAGFHLRNPPIYRRVGIPGSGGPDWLRTDYEWIVCFARGGRLPWSDNTACGHPPKWAPGGDMSHRLKSGQRVNKWGNFVNEDGVPSGNEPGTDADKRKTRKPSHEIVVVGGISSDAPPLPGMEAPPEKPVADEWGRTGESRGKTNRGGRSEDGTIKKGKPHTKRRAGKEGARTKSSDQPDGTTEDQTYLPPVLANPGNTLAPTYTEDEVRALLARCGVTDAAASEVLDMKVGGGQMGNELCHLNEAPFPEALIEFFVLSFCPPGGVVADCFAGSGTSLAVALRHGRRAIGCDLRESQVALTRRRVSGETPDLFATPTSGP